MSNIYTQGYMPIQLTNMQQLERWVVGKKTFESGTLSGWESGLSGRQTN